MRSMIRHILYILIALPILAGSCSGRKNKVIHRNIIPEKDLVLILTDVYLADGLLGVPEIHYKYAVGDTLSSYIDIIENYGYTKTEMDRTMRFYFVKKPKTLVKIYDKVLGKLSEMEALVDKELPGAGSKATNIWPGKPFYSYPDPTFKDSTWFDFPVSYSRTFNLRFTLTLYPDDQSTDPRSGLFVSHTDSAGTEKRIWFTKLPLLKDGQPHTYNIRLIHTLPDPVRIKGWFINQEGMTPFREMHFRVENIILSANLID